MITVYQCGKNSKHEPWAVYSFRPRQSPVCPTCGSTNPTPIVEKVSHVDGWPVNRPHSVWLKVVDRITRRWLLAEIAYAGTADGTAAMAFPPVNEERHIHGLGPLTWEDVRDEAEKATF